MFDNLKPLDLSDIISIPFSQSQYIQEVFTKTQVVIHHTISGDGLSGDLETWENDPKRIATCIIIDRKGVPYQLFSSKYYAYHIGANNSELEKHSIGVELDNWGGLKKINDRYYTLYGTIVKVPIQYYEIPYRGYNYFEKYSIEQLTTLGKLLLYWKARYNIPLTYNEDMWDLSDRALNGTPGIWSHTSFIKTKSDVHPQPELITLLKQLSNIFYF